jgi:hypothetical protein
LINFTGFIFQFFICGLTATLNASYSFKTAELMSANTFYARVPTNEIKIKKIQKI